MDGKNSGIPSRYNATTFGRSWKRLWVQLIEQLLSTAFQTIGYRLIINVWLSQTSWTSDWEQLLRVGSSKARSDDWQGFLEFDESHDWRRRGIYWLFEIVTGLIHDYPGPGWRPDGTHRRVCSASSRRMEETERIFRRADYCQSNGTVLKAFDVTTSGRWRGAESCEGNGEEPHTAALCWCQNLRRT